MFEDEKGFILFKNCSFHLEKKLKIGTFYRRLPMEKFNIDQAKEIYNNVN